MPELELELLGSPVFRHGGRAVALPTRKTAALLIYLAVEGRWHSREKLVSLLWPERDAEHGRGALRSTLSLLRRSLSEGEGPMAHLIGRGGSLGLETAGLVLDVGALEAAYRLARAPEGPPVAARVAQLKAGLGALRGEFLEGFSLSDAPDFDNWTSAQRERWQRRADRVFASLTGLLLDGGQVEEAREWADRWLARDRLNEAAHRRAIEALLAASDRAAAARAYEACRMILATELGAEPAPETEALAARIRAAPPAVARPSPSERGLPGGRVFAPPLVGRLTEHTELSVAFREARRGRARAVLLEGESGIGKTRLASEFLRWAAGQGAIILHGRAHEIGGRMPYQALVEALRQGLAGPVLPAVLPALAPVWRTALGRLLPELAVSELGPFAAGLGEASARAQLFEAVGQLGRALGARAPFVLFLDDLQWADTATLDLTLYVARAWAKSVPAFLLLSLRAEALEGAPEGLAWLDALGRELPLRRLALGPLTAEDSQTLARAVLPALFDGALFQRTFREDRSAPSGPAVSRIRVQGRFRDAGDDIGPDGDEADDPGRALSAWLYAESDGHPLYLVEILKALPEEGGVASLARSVSAVGFDGRAAGGPTIDAQRRGYLPPGLQQAIQARFARLSAPAREGLTAAAVLGERFGFAEPCQVAGLTEDEGLPALDSLLGARILRELTAARPGPARLAFVHDKLRETAYAGTSATRRAAYHRRALAALAPDRASAADLARHAEAAGLPDAAAAHWLEAGEEALRLFAIHDAIGYLARARALAGAAKATLLPPEALARLHLQLGRAHELAGERTEAQEVYTALLERARVGGDGALAGRTLNRLATLAAQEFRGRERPLALLREARAAAEAAGDRLGLAETEWNLAQTAAYWMDLAAARRHGARALRLARALDRPDLVARALMGVAFAERYDRWAQSAANAERAAARYAALGNRALQADALCVAAAARVRFGQAGAALARAREAREISEAIENTDGRINSGRELAMALLETGAYGEAQACARDTVEVARRAGYRPLLGLSLITLGNIQRGCHATAEAISAHTEASALIEAQSLGHLRELVASELCADAIAAGDWDTARLQAERALAHRNPQVPAIGFTRWQEAAARVQAGALETAAADLAAFGARLGANRRYRLVHRRGLAIVAAAGGDPAGARDQLGGALLLADALGLPGERWQILAALAELEGALGATESARRHRAEAATTLAALAASLPEREARRTFLAAPGLARP
jgi:DNA-binding SARP family transcriptional activator/predicted ATPase